MVLIRHRSNLSHLSTETDKMAIPLNGNMSGVIDETFGSATCQTSCLAEKINDAGVDLDSELQDNEVVQHFSPDVCISQ